jgi:hypothetical protein
VWPWLTSCSANTKQVSQALTCDVWHVLADC